ncbi:CotH kinase family protein [bacterium SCSIO 12741]|nr:CotH kinase family protein [bacterium SCSIO 12741]
MKKVVLVALMALMFSVSAWAQYGAVNHWETAVLETDEWAYFEGTTAPPQDWNKENYDDSSWKKGKGSFGYGDGDDSTVVNQATSLYLRIKFNISDTSKFVGAVLSADFDDAFVAYINGVEMTRENIGTVWTEPAYNDLADFDREAQLYQGGKRSDYLIKKFQLAYSIKNGNNVLAIQVHNNTTFSSDMSAFFNLTFGIKDASTHFSAPPSWFVTPPMFEEYSSLPIVRLTSAKLNDSVKIPGTMEIAWNGEGQNTPFDQAGNHYDGHIAIKYRGNSTLEFPKKSFRIETQDSVGENNNVSLFGFPKENDWVLYAPYSDKSLLRNYLTYNLGRTLWEYAPRTQLVEVFHNGYYLGVYVFTEKVKRDKNRVAIKKLDSSEVALPDLSGGYMLRIDWPEGLCRVIHLRFNTPMVSQGLRT